MIRVVVLVVAAWVTVAMVCGYATSASNIHGNIHAARSDRSLAAQARFEAAHGGVLGTAHGAATPRMRWLSRRLVIRRFTPAGPGAVRTALCIVQRESGGNPGAISATGDWGLAQVNRQAHEGDHPDWWRSRLGFTVALLDPVFNVGVMFAMSQRGTDWGPWTGTYGRGMCR